MSRPPLYLTTIGVNVTNAKTPHLGSTPAGMKMLDPKPLTLKMQLSKCNEKEHVPEDLESNPLSSDLSLSEYDSSNDRKYSKSKSKRRNKNKNHRKRTKQDSSKSSFSNYDSPNEIDYKIKRLNKKKIHQGKYPIKLCAKLTEKLLKTAYKSNIIKLKLGEDPLQHWIYFLAFI